MFGKDTKNDVRMSLGVFYLNFGSLRRLFQSAIRGSKAKYFYWLKIYSVFGFFATTLLEVKKAYSFVPDPN